MTPIIAIAPLSVLACAPVVLIRWQWLRLTRENPVGLPTLVEVLFTARLDMGRIMLPLTEFPVCEGDPAFGVTNALAVELGSGGRWCG